MIETVVALLICSAIHGNCLPEQSVDVYDSWYNCAASGTNETTELMKLIGEDLINNNKIYITFSCRPQNEV
jgi:hypothetical protein